MASFFVRPFQRDFHAELHQFGQRLGIQLHVFRLAGVKLKIGDVIGVGDALIEIQQRRNQLPGQRGRQLLGV